SSAARRRSSRLTSSPKFPNGPRSSRPRARSWIEELREALDAMNTVESETLSRNVRRLGHLDPPGAGQVTVRGSHAYVGHIPNPVHLGTSIIDIGDPRQPRVVATVTLDDHDSHSHKVRVAGDIMIVNHERNMSKIGRRAEQLPAARRGLGAARTRE